MSILTPCYRLNGDLWFEMRPITRATVSYNIECHPDFIRDGRWGFPPHAHAACMEFHNTIHALLSAGF